MAKNEVKRNEKANKVNDLVALIEKGIEALTPLETQELTEKLNLKIQETSKKAKLAKVIAPYDLYEVKWTCKMAVYAKNHKDACRVAKRYYTQADDPDPVFEAWIITSETEAKTLDGLSLFYDDDIFGEAEKADVDFFENPQETPSSLFKLKG